MGRKNACDEIDGPWVRELNGRDVPEMLPTPLPRCDPDIGARRDADMFENAPRGAELPVTPVFGLEVLVCMLLR